MKKKIVDKDLQVKYQKNRDVASILKTKKYKIK